MNELLSILEDLKQEDYDLYCHCQISHLDEKQWEWLIKVAKERSEKNDTD